MMMVLTNGRIASRRWMPMIVQQAARGGRRHISSQRKQSQQRIFARSSHLAHIQRKGKDYRHSTAAAGAGSMDAFPCKSDNCP
jgi:hypothetical protein